MLGRQFRIAAELLDVLQCLFVEAAVLELLEEPG